MQTLMFKCNALIEGRNPLNYNSIIEKNNKRFGNWIGGTVHLGSDSLIFSTNAMNAKFQEIDSDLALSYDEINTCRLGRMMFFFKTVDLETDHGSVRFRCMGAFNNKLIAELVSRRKIVTEKISSIISQLTTLNEVPVSDSIFEIAGALCGKFLWAGIYEPIKNTNSTSGSTIPLLVGQDVDGNSWLYLYTSKKAMIIGGLADKLCVSMQFEAYFEIALQQNFGGFIVDAEGDHSLTLVTAEYFDEMATVLAAKNNNNIP